MKNILYFFLIVVFASCEQIEYKTLQGTAIGTTYSIKYSDSENINFEILIERLVSDMNQSLSTYITDSDISRINNGEKDVVIDSYFEEIYSKSKHIFEDTDGYFDPTLGILVNYWGFGPDDKTKKYDKETFEALREFVGFDKIRLEYGKIIKEHPEIYLDFNAIAKGYLVDVIGRLFESYGIENYLVEIGGEIRARGVNEEGSYWTVAIESPNTDGTRSLAKIITLNNESIATSGNYRKYKINDRGTKYVHTVNAKTGYAFQSSLLSASVVSKLDCADVDAYATAFMSMGYVNTLTFLQSRPHLKAFLIYSDENGKIQTDQVGNLGE